MEVKIIIGVILFIALHIGLWKLFEKAKYKGWYSFVPIFDLVIWLRLIKKPWWWILILMIPGVNLVLFLVMLYNLAEAYGKESLAERVFAMFVAPVALPLWGFDQKVRYIGPDTNRQRSTGEQWVDAIVFAIIAATIIRTFFIEAFQIPTSSMEKSLMVGDFLFVSKVSYGARSPMTPLTIPFTHSTLPLTTDVPSYLEWITLPYFRLPGLGHVERGDVVVFNFPEGDTVATGQPNNTYYQYERAFGKDMVRSQKNTFGKIVYRPVDKRDHYVKRCVGIPGDKLQVRNDTLIINGEVQPFPPNAQLRYEVASSAIGFAKKARELGTTSEDLKYVQSTRSIPIPFSKLPEYKKLLSLKGTYKYIEDSSLAVIPHNLKLAQWTVQNFGPIHIPKEGETVALDSMNLALYGRCITAYEGNKMEVKDGKILINGTPATSYTFKQDYYWMMGDNRHGSLDSRYWGFVPYDHVVGKPVMVWLSMDPDKKFPMNIRWERLVSFVGKDGISRSYAIPLVILIGLLIVLNNLYKKGRLNFMRRK